MQAIRVDDKDPRIIYQSGWYNDDGHATDFNRYVVTIRSLERAKGLKDCIYYGLRLRLPVQVQR